MKFQGCQCSGCRCQTRACPCFASSRECDPDLCRACQSHIVPSELQSERICKNVSIQYSKGKVLGLGGSVVHGWGAFVRESIEKGELITEYVGELISQEEADRRGQIYDKLNISYLFNLNEELVVDAARKGNKIKFANHNENSNAISRVMRVNGDQRIGIYAKRNISAGEELYFNYHHNRVEEAITPSWMQRTSTGSRKMAS